jgi:hypothetical protein
MQHQLDRLIDSGEITDEGQKALSIVIEISSRGRRPDDEDISNVQGLLDTLIREQGDPIATTIVSIALDSLRGDVNEEETPQGPVAGADVSGALAGGAFGMEVGTAGGPWGIAVGGSLGALWGGVAASYAESGAL